MVLAHAGCLLGIWWVPRGVIFLLGLNAVVAIAILGYAASRALLIFAAMDWPYLGLIAFETAVLGGAIWAWRGHRSALICSYAAFGLHSLASTGAVVFAFAFKLKKLI